MRHSLWIAFCAGLTAFALVGCGGGGSGSSQPPGSSPFVGAFAGPFSTSQGQSGAMGLVVSPSGSVAGTLVNTTAASAASLTGSIGGGGNASLSDAVGTVNGTLAFNPSGQLAGTVQNAQGVVYSVALSSTQTGATAMYAGSYNGTFTNPQGQSGTITMIATSGGNVTGLIVNITSNTTTAVTGTITSAGALLLNASTGGGTVTGTLAPNQSSQLTGTLDDQGATIDVVLDKV